MLRKTRLLALSLSLLAVYSHAQASVISVSNVTTGNLSGVSVLSNTPSTYTGTYTSWSQSDYSNTTVLSTELAVAPTTTAPGLEKDYSTNTVKYNDNTTTYKYDRADLALATTGLASTGGKTISLSGSVHSTIATTVTIELNARGSYLPGGSVFGESVPALASLFLGGTSFAPTASSSIYIDSASHSYLVSNGWSYTFTIGAGETVSFQAGVYAPLNASLDYLNLNLLSAYYDPVTVTTPFQQVTKTLVEARAIPPLAVPEPSTYAMLLAGLGVVGMARRRGFARNTVASA